MTFGTTRTVAVTLLTVSCAWGCNDETDTGGGGNGPSTSSSTTTTTSDASTTSTASSTGSGTGSSMLEITWTPCPLDSDGGASPMVECATIEVPVDWKVPDGEKIDFFVKRIPSSNQPAHRQIWFLNGGPGYSGANYDYMQASAIQDIYLPDHRGTGRSSRLSCPAAEDENTEDSIRISIAEFPACVDAMKAEWGDRLNGFTITNAAHDIGHVIAATKEAGDAVYVYGGSYGTALANRYLLLYPDQPTAVILDAPAVVSKLDRFDVWMDQLAHDWSDACAADALCTSKMGPDPWATWTQGLDDLDAGNCPGIADLGYDRNFLIDLWGQLFYDWDFRAITLPMVHRLARCAPEDVKVYENFLAALYSPPPTTTDRYYSDLLSAHISLSELWTEPAPTVAEIDAFRATAAAGHPIVGQFSSVSPTWPRYPKDEHFGVLAPSSKPILTMHGQYDFIPGADAEVVGMHFDGPLQTYVEIPHAPHGTFGAPAADGGPNCAQKVFSQFLTNPMVAPDTSCTAGVAPLVFAPPPGDSAAYFGTNDPWDGIPPGTQPPPPSPAIARALRELRLRLPTMQRLQRLPHAYMGN